MRLTVRSGLFALLFLALAAGCETASAQSPVRGRIVDRDGLFHVTRYRWGNGLTSNGVAAIGIVAPLLANVANTALSKDLDEPTDAQKKAIKDLEDQRWARYIQQQESANMLLMQTAGLVGWQPGASPIVPPQPQTLGQPGDATSYGADPYKPRP